jgi:hypothetical protein
MDFLSTTKFQSSLYPEVKVTFRVVTAGRRIDLIRNWREVNSDVAQESRLLWNLLVKDFEGVTVDGKKPTIEDFYLEGPEDLVEEIRTELIRMIQPLHKTDSGDEAIIESARQQIAEAEARIAERKNSEPQSFTSPIRTAASVAEPQTMPAEFESDEIAMASPI